MKKIILYASCMLTLCVLAACSLPASTSPQVLPTNTSAVPFPVVTSAQAVHDVISGTQTAQALSGTTMPTSQLPTVSFASSVTPQSSQGSVTGTSQAVVYTTPTITSTRPAFATSTPGRPATYTVQKGEHCYCLARRFDVDPPTLMQANSHCSDNPLQPGTVITIPQTSEWPGERWLKAHPTNYTVTTGETIYSIACEFGDVDPNVIIAANALVSPYTLTAGQVIYIP